MSGEADGEADVPPHLSHAGAVLVDDAPEGKKVPLGRGVWAVKNGEDLWGISANGTVVDWICPSRFLSAQEILTHCYNLTGGGSLRLEDGDNREPEERGMGYQ